MMSGPIESSDDDVSRRVAQAACDSDTSGSDHAVDDKDGSDSEDTMRREFVGSMAAESRSLQSDEGYQRGLGSLRNGLAACSLFEASANHTQCQFDQRRTDVLASEPDTVGCRVACAPRADNQRRPHIRKERGFSPPYTPRTIHAPAY